MHKACCREGGMLCSPGPWPFGLHVPGRQSQGQRRVHRWDLVWPGQTPAPPHLCCFATCLSLRLCHRHPALAAGRCLFHHLVQWWCWGPPLGWRLGRCPAIVCSVPVDENSCAHVSPWGVTPPPPVKVTDVWMRCWGHLPWGRKSLGSVARSSMDKAGLFTSRVSTAR